MPVLTPGQQGTTYRSALGKIGSQPGMSSVELANWLRDDYAHDPSYSGITYSSYAAIARRALAAHYAGQAMEEDRNFAPLAGELETIPGSQYRTERFQYRVVVEYTDQDGNRISSVVEYESPTAVSANQIQNDLSSRVFTTSDQRTVDVMGTQVPGGISGLDVRVIAAGRRAS